MKKFKARVYDGFGTAIDFAVLAETPAQVWVAVRRELSRDSYHQEYLELVEETGYPYEAHVYSLPRDQDIVEVDGDDDSSVWPGLSAERPLSVLGYEQGYKS